MISEIFTALPPEVEYPSLAPRTGHAQGHGHAPRLANGVLADVPCAEAVRDASLVGSTSRGPVTPREANMPGSCCPFCQGPRIKAKEKAEPEPCLEPSLAVVPELPADDPRAHENEACCLCKRH